MKTLFMILFSILMGSAVMAKDRIDEYPGLFEIKVGDQFSKVDYLFSSTREKEVSTGKLYYVLLNPSQSEYSEVLGASIDKLLVYVVNGAIEEVIVIYPVATKLSVITAEAEGHYGKTPCIVHTKQTEGCIWNGEKYALQVSVKSSNTIIARFTRINS